jgi:hypothetical protein
MPSDGAPDRRMAGGIARIDPPAGVCPGAGRAGLAFPRERLIFRRELSLAILASLILDRSFDLLERWMMLYAYRRSPE